MLRLSFTDLTDLSQDGGAPSDRRLVKSYPQLLRELINDNLTKKQKCYIIMYYRDGLTVTEIAERYGVNRSTVSRTVRRGRERLANAIKCELVRRRIEQSAKHKNINTEDTHEENADS